MSKPRLLDLFCGAGGAAVGYDRAGFEVVGVDIAPQPNYPFEFHQCDALAVARDRFNGCWHFQGYAGPCLGLFDAIHASPPCQFRTAYNRRPAHVAASPNLIPATREILEHSDLPYVIENVEFARDQLWHPVRLCGSSFELNVRRHRLFECSFPLLVPPCDHSWQQPRFPPATNRTNLRRTVEIGVWRISLDVQQEAMGIDWMTLPELSQAIPPAYTEHIGGYLWDAAFEATQDRHAMASGRWDA